MYYNSWILKNHDQLYRFLVTVTANDIFNNRWVSCGLFGHVLSWTLDGWLGEDDKLTRFRTWHVYAYVNFFTLIIVFICRISYALAATRGVLSGRIGTYKEHKFFNCIYLIALFYSWRQTSLLRVHVYNPASSCCTWQIDNWPTSALGLCFKFHLMKKL